MPVWPVAAAIFRNTEGLEMVGSVSSSSVSQAVHTDMIAFLFSLLAEMGELGGS